MLSRIAGCTLAAVLIAGCQAAQTPAGPVVAATPQPGWEYGPAVGLTAPKVQFTTQDRKTQWLRGDTEWITLLAFVQGPEKECELIVPTLVQTAARYHDRPVRVAQVAVPVGGTPRCSSCIEISHVQEMHLIALCDGAHQAYGAFGKPPDGTLLLIGGDGKVLAVSKVNRIGDLYPRVDQMAKDLEKKQMPAYMQLYVQ